jgi:hypothetical protein
MHGLTPFLAEWVARTPDDGKKAISILPVKNKKPAEESKP